MIQNWLTITSANSFSIWILLLLVWTVSGPCDITNKTHEPQRLISARSEHWRLFFFFGWRYLSSSFGGTFGLHCLSFKGHWGHWAFFLTLALTFHSHNSFANTCFSISNVIFLIVYYLSIWFQSFIWNLIWWSEELSRTVEIFFLWGMPLLRPQ